MSDFQFDAELWLYDGDAAWHFITVPQDISDEIDSLMTGTRRGFGSVPVRAVVGGTTWTTSVFPSKQAGAFILPVKAEVRRRENLSAGAATTVTISLLDA